jgi:hypothetical protein
LDKGEIVIRVLLAAMLAAAAGQALAQADVGLVNLVSGEVSFVPQSGAAGKAKPFMKVREGDRFEVAAGAQVRLVYFDGARQERWQGPARFRAAKTQGTAISGKPAEVTFLPSSVPQRIARVPELMQNAKLGGVQVRGVAPRRDTPGSAEAVREARATYEKLRKDLPGDDITAELYLYAVLSDYQLYDDMKVVVQEMLRKQPDSEDVKSLASFVGSRASR